MGKQLKVSELFEEDAEFSEKLNTSKTKKGVSLPQGGITSEVEIGIDHTPRYNWGQECLRNSAERDLQRP